jgi:MATE family multidrug resistance protein
MAKSIGSASGLAVLVFAYLRKQNREESASVRSFRFDASAAGKLLRYGSPTGLEMFSGFMAFNALVLIFHSRGLVTATAATIMLNRDMNLPLWVGEQFFMNLVLGAPACTQRCAGTGS